MSNQPLLLIPGGGLGGTRRGGPEVNIKHSGREDNERERERYRLEREREDRGGRSGGPSGMDRERGGDSKDMTSLCIIQILMSSICRV